MIRPYQKPRPHSDVALLAYAQSVEPLFITEDGEQLPLRAIATKGIKLYGDRRLARGYLKAGIGEAECWNNVPVKWILGKHTVTLLPNTLEVDIRSLAQWRDWIESYGAAISSVVGSSMSLLRATLEQPLYLDKGTLPPLPTVVGGRVDGIKAGVYGAFDAWDISAAYARCVGSLRISGTWRECTDIDKATFVQAALTVPDMPYGPLPLRDAKLKQSLVHRVFDRREYPVRKRIEGIWTADEVRMAVEHGAKLKRIRQGWRLFHDSREPFGQWWEAIQIGRRLEGMAGEMAKLTGNTLWGLFCAYGKKSRIRYENHKLIKQPLPDPPSFNRSFALAEMVTSTIRTQLFRELIAPAGEHLISVCVDGGLIHHNGFRPIGDRWKLKEHGSNLVFIVPYCYSYRADDGSEVFKMAGVPEGSKATAFRTIKQVVLGWPTNRNPSDRALALHRLRDKLGARIEREGPSEVDRYFGSAPPKEGR